MFHENVQFFTLLKSLWHFAIKIHLGILNPTMVDNLLIIHEGPKATFYHDILYLLKLNKLIIVYFYSERNGKSRICKIKKIHIFH